MENSFQYFENRDCKYYPCHKGIEHINCLFCYCPLYSMQNCPGNYIMIEVEGKPLKSCMDCSFPHKAENYDKVNAILKQQFKNA
ncbi:MAG: cysteine-rich small domain-containing protein [Lachnospiraceae bacterium]|nr:cysteine-rich small domain-containing protein [Lachnospiraceae bacterium]